MSQLEQIMSSFPLSGEALTAIKNNIVKEGKS